MGETYTRPYIKTIRLQNVSIVVLGRKVTRDAYDVVESGTMVISVRYETLEDIESAVQIIAGRFMSYVTGLGDMSTVENSTILIRGQNVLAVYTKDSEPGVVYIARLDKRMIGCIIEVPVDLLSTFIGGEKK